MGSTVTRLTTHILVRAKRRNIISDGVLVNERMVERGRLDRLGGKPQILGRSDTSMSPSSRRPVAGLVLRGMGYESNEVSVVTNVTDHPRPAGHSRCRSWPR